MIKFKITYRISENREVEVYSTEAKNIVIAIGNFLDDNYLRPSHIISIK